MTTVIHRIIPLLLIVIGSFNPYACAQSASMDRSADVKVMVKREIPVGMSREAALARLDSLRIPFTVLDSTRVRALVRNTSKSAVATGSLQVILVFDREGKLQRHEFRELFVAP